MFVYGIHGSLERFYGVIHFLARFGRVIAPDLPGFGGMETLAKANRKQNLDNVADYLAEVLEREIPEGQITLVGLSYGFVVITRMLERQTVIANRSDMAISLMGLVDGQDLAMRGFKRFGAEVVTLLARTPVISVLYSAIVSSRWMLNLMYRPNHPKMRALGRVKRAEFIEFESYLWRCNDLATWGRSLHELFHLSARAAQLPVPLFNIATKHDHWLDIATTEAHLRMEYAFVTTYSSDISNHGGVAYEDEQEAYAMIPREMATRLESV